MKVFMVYGNDYVQGIITDMDCEIYLGGYCE